MVSSDSKRSTCFEFSCPHYSKWATFRPVPKQEGHKNHNDKPQGERFKTKRRRRRVERRAASTGRNRLTMIVGVVTKLDVLYIGIRAVPEIILGVGGPQALFCPVGGGGCFVDNVSEGWGISLTNPVRGVGGLTCPEGQGVFDPQ